MRPRLVLLVLAALVPLAVLGVLLLRESEGEPAPAAAPAGGMQTLERCADALTPDRARACFEQALQTLVVAADDPRQVVARVGETAYAQAGFLLPNCHGLMHTVGRRYVAAHGVTLATLMDFLPRTNDPGCAAGFAHGLVAGVAPQIDVRDPRGAAAVCGDAPTRYRRYSCVHGFGHAFMRLNGEHLPAALAMCTALGELAAPDCAQGSFHDYWFAVSGLDGLTASADRVTDPRVLCAAQFSQYVRPCWYRAFVDSRPTGFQTETADDLERLCAELVELQRSACITAASVIGPPDPAVQLALCAELAGADAVSCIRGTKVQNLLREPPAAFDDLISRCAAFPAPTAGACYRWLGKVLAVVTDGGFERTGCPQLPDVAARDACVAGARSAGGALVTFS